MSETRYRIGSGTVMRSMFLVLLLVSQTSLTAFAQVVTESIPIAEEIVVPVHEVEPSTEIHDASPVVLNVGSLSELESLSVLSGQTVLLDFSTAPTLSITGDITNAGQIFAYSTNPANTGATLSAANVANQQASIISTILPSSMLTFISGTINSAFDLQILAAQNIINSGTISSSGNLSLIAGGTITNALPESVIASIAPTLAAANSVNLIAASGNLINQGQILAAAGNVNIATVLDTYMAGSIQQNSAVQSVLASASAATDINILGGLLRGNEINIIGGAGAVNVNVAALDGITNVTAAISHVRTEGDLALGRIALTGDPTFYSNGNISLNAPIGPLNGESLAIVAAGDITTANGADFSIDTTNAAGNGGNVLLAAGAQFNITPCSTCANQGLQPIRLSGTSDNLTITGSSATGGNILLQNGSSASSIRTDGSDSAGNVTLLAFAGNDGTAGRILLAADSTISATGGTSNGNITVHAENGTAGTSIQLGNITGAETIDIQTGRISGAPISEITNNDGANQVPTIINNASTSTCCSAGSISLNQVQSANNLNIRTDGDISTNALQARNVWLEGNSISVNGDINGNSNVALLFDQSLYVNGNVRANGDALQPSGGFVTILGTTPSDFVIGAATSSGITGRVTADGFAGGDGGGLALYADSPRFVVADSNAISAASGVGGTYGGLYNIHNRSGSLELAQGTYGGANYFDIDIAGNGLSVVGTNGQPATAPAVIQAPSILSITNFAAGQAMNFDNDAGSFAVDGFNSGYLLVNGAGDINIDAAAVNTFWGISLVAQNPLGSDANVLVSGGDITAPSFGASSTSNASMVATNATVNGTTGLILSNDSVGFYNNGSGGVDARTYTSPAALYGLSFGSPGGTVRFAGGQTLSANYVGIDGDVISIEGRGPLNIESDGTVYVSAIQSDLAIGNQQGQINILGTATTINALAGGDLSVDVGSLSFSPTAFITLQAGMNGSGNLLVNNTLNVAPLSGTSGDVFLSSASSTPFVIGNSIQAPTVNGINGSIVANDGGVGGRITVINSGSGGIFLNSSNDVQYDGYTPAYRSLTLTASQGTLSMPGNGITAANSGVYLEGYPIEWRGGPNSPYVFDVSNLSITTSPDAQGAPVIGNGNGQYQITIQDDYSANLTFISTADLTIDTSAINFTGDAEHQITLQAGAIDAGDLQITGSILLNAGTGPRQVINLSSNSDQPFTYSSGVPTANGITGSATSTGYTTLNIANSGTGGITIADLSALPRLYVVDLSFTAPNGPINIAEGDMYVSGGLVVQGQTVNVIGNTGPLVIHSGAFSSNTITATDGPLSIGNGVGDISISTGCRLCVGRLNLTGGQWLLVDMSGLDFNVNPTVGPFVNFYSGSTAPFVISSDASDVTSNGIIGNINYPQGGLTFAAGGPIVIEEDTTISTNYDITFAGYPYQQYTPASSSNLSVINNGTVQSEEGPIGFYTGPQAAANISGTGSFTAPQLQFGVFPNGLSSTASGPITIAPTLTLTGEQIMNPGLAMSTQNIQTVDGSLTAAPTSAPIPSPVSAPQAVAEQPSAQTAAGITLPNFNTERFNATRQGTGVATDTIALSTGSPLHGDVQVNEVIDTETGSLDGQVITGDSNTSKRSLKDSNLLLAPNATLQVETAEALITVEKGSLAFIVQTGDTTCVYNLFDEHFGDVNLQIGNETLKLGLGQQILLTRNREADFAALNPLNHIAVRRIKEATCENGLRAYSADFSMLTAIGHIQPLRQLIKDNNAARITSKLLKTTAALAIVVKREAYRHTK